MSRRWGLAAGLVAIAGFAVGLAFALHSSTDAGIPMALGTHASVGQLALPIPRGFNSYSLPTGDGPGSSPVPGHMITNFRPPAKKTIEWVLGYWRAAQQKFMLVKHHDTGPPSNEVALELGESSRSPGCIGPCSFPPARLHLPLEPNQPWFEEQLASGGHGVRDGYLFFRHHRYYVMYWIGPDAPAGDRAAVLSALQSIRPAR